MVDLFNFLINNVEPILFVIICTALGGAFFTAFYFFVYSYAVNKRLKNPEKKHRIKLIMPRYACIIIVILSLLCSLKMTNKQIMIGYIGISTYWQTDYAFVQPAYSENGDRHVYEEKDSAEKDPDLKKYTARSGYFEYTLYYNTKFNGIIDQNSFNYADNNPRSYKKECEYTLFVEYIGKDKELGKDDFLEIDAENIRDKKTYFGAGGGFSNSMEETPVVFYGSSSANSAVALESVIYKSKSYERMVEASEKDEESNERDYQYLKEKVVFDLNKMTFDSPKTELIGN
ncbi:MAG: hypothetical protein IIU14_06060 [Ruminococcus sp.]|nr:hypothetical protein [Ruminococcus sp.]